MPNAIRGKANRIELSHHQRLATLGPQDFSQHLILLEKGPCCHFFMGEMLMLRLDDHTYLYTQESLWSLLYAVLQCTC